MIAFLSFRYAFSKEGGHRARVLRIIAALALSLAVLVSVLSIMDYLQRSRFDDIRKVRSFDIIVSGDHKEELQEIFPDSPVFVYAESEAIIDGKAYLLRYIDSDYGGELRYLSGDNSGLLIPYSLYRIDRKKQYTLSLLKKGRSGARLPQNESYSVSGIYSTSLGSEFDSTMVFLPLSLYDGSDSVTAVMDSDMSKRDILKEKGLVFHTWKESESSLYSAFVIEKTMMYSVLSLLFIIIAVSGRQSVRIFFRAKEKERAELEILGFGRKKTASVFILSFMIVALIAVIVAFALSCALIPLLERLLSSLIYSRAVLEIPVGGFLFFSVFSMSALFIFSLSEAVKGSRRDLVEVINE